MYKNLQRLYLVMNQISNLNPLMSLKNLEILDLSWYQITNLSNLNNLFLHCNQMTDLTSLSKLYNLIHLSLCENMIKDIKPLGDLNGIKILRINDNQISDLSLANNKIVDLIPLGSLKNIHTLNLEGNQINDLTPLVNLVEMSLLWLTIDKNTDVTILKRLKCHVFKDFV